jgi:hypothetical protein
MNDIQKKLTEDKTVLLLIDYLKANGYVIHSHCLGHQRGYDIVPEGIISVDKLIKIKDFL